MDEYVAELRTGVLHKSSIHSDQTFWVMNAELLVTEVRDVLPMLADIICDESAAADIESQKIACSDLVHIIRRSVNGRWRALTLPPQSLKPRLMTLMAASEDLDLRRQALSCVQLLLLSKH